MIGWFLQAAPSIHMKVISFLMMSGCHLMVAVRGQKVCVSILEPRKLSRENSVQPSFL